MVDLGPLDQLRIVVGRNQNDRCWTLLTDDIGGLNSIHYGHFDIGNDQVRLKFAAMLDQLPAGLGDGNHLMSQ